MSCTEVTRRSSHTWPLRSAHQAEVLPDRAAVASITPSSARKSVSLARPSTMRAWWCGLARAIVAPSAMPSAS